MLHLTSLAIKNIEDIEKFIFSNERKFLDKFMPTADELVHIRFSSSILEYSFLFLDSGQICINTIPIQVFNEWLSIISIELIDTVEYVEDLIYQISDESSVCDLRKIYEVIMYKNNNDVKYIEQLFSKLILNVNKMSVLISTAILRLTSCRKTDIANWFRLYTEIYKELEYRGINAEHILRGLDKKENSSNILKILHDNGIKNG